jgi:glycosyltransferase involved in cell wall biosynthesis
MSNRVAFLFVGDSIGGSHISASLLMRQLPEHGFAPFAFVHRHGMLSDWLNDRGLQVVCHDLPFLPPGSGGIPAILRLATITPRLALFLRQNDIRLAHTNDGRTAATWMPACRLAGTKAIAHQRTRWVPSRLANWTMRLADRIIPISNFVRNSMPLDVQERAAVVANPFDFDVPGREAGRSAVESLIGSAAPVVAFVGTLQSQKRPEIFLGAAARINRRRPDVRYLMVGRDGEVGAEMRRLCAEYGLSDVVTFAGFRSDVLTLLAGSAVLLAPAVDEGQGRAVIEAMICGVPVVAADSGGHSEIIKAGTTGFLVKPDDAEGLATAALSILERPELAKAIARAACDWVRSAFSPTVHARAVADEYRRCWPDEPRYSSRH